MDNRDKDIHMVNDPDESEYLGGDEEETPLDFGGLFSNRFTNIKHIYTSASGPTEIYSATRYGKRYVLKGLKEQYRNDPIYNLALAKEFEIGISLDHPNIRRTIGLETVDGIGKVIVLEYIDGRSLDTLIASGTLSVSQARSIAEQIAAALTYIHSKQVFHRDLKPSNIVVSHIGDVIKIIDFNLSDSDDFIVLKNPAGSRRYMAPEQFKAGARPSASADIYSMGVILEELAAVNRDEELLTVAEKCTNHNPDRRPQSVASLRLPASRPTAMQGLSNILSSRVLTYLMLCICIALAVVDVFMLICD